LNFEIPAPILNTHIPAHSVSYITLRGGRLHALSLTRKRQKLRRFVCDRWV